SRCPPAGPRSWRSPPSGSARGPAAARRNTPPRRRGRRANRIPAPTSSEPLSEPGQGGVERREHRQEFVQLGDVKDLAQVPVRAARPAWAGGTGRPPTPALRTTLDPPGRPADTG